MLFYGIGVLPLTRMLKNVDSWKQNWYEDGSGCFGLFANLRQWVQLLLEEGPKFGYFPEPDKSYLVVNPGFVDIAKEHFKDLGLNINVHCNRPKIFRWIYESWLLQAISSLTAASVDNPQAAFKLILH